METVPTLDTGFVGGVPVCIRRLCADKAPPPLFTDLTGEEIQSENVTMKFTTQHDLHKG